MLASTPAAWLARSGCRRTARSLPNFRGMGTGPRRAQPTHEASVISRNSTSSHRRTSPVARASLRSPDFQQQLELVLPSPEQQGPGSPRRAIATPPLVSLIDDHRRNDAPARWPWLPSTCASRQTCRVARAYSPLWGLSVRPHGVRTATYAGAYRE